MDQIHTSKLFLYGWLLNVKRTYAWILFTIPGVPPSLASLCLSCKVFSTRDLNLQEADLAECQHVVKKANLPGLEVSLSSTNDPVGQLYSLPIPLLGVIAVDVLPLWYRFS
jgi:hypothetical protein